VVEVFSIVFARCRATALHVAGHTVLPSHREQKAESTYRHCCSTKLPMVWFDLPHTHV